MNYRYIDDVANLVDYCQASLEANAIAVDTEFVRTRTFYPILGLVQINNGIETVLIDPIAIDDLSALRELMQTPKVIKVFHAPSEDIEAFMHALDCIPSPLFDTQIASALCGVGPTVGYGRMVLELLNIELEKGEARTDWVRRPLSSEQLRYAADDVIYLLQCYTLLCEKLTDAQYAIVMSEMHMLSDKKSAHLPAEYAYLTYKNIWRLKPVQLHVLQLLAQWRLEKARRDDITQNFITREMGLYQIAQSMPTYKGAVFDLDALTPVEARKYHIIYLRCVEQAKQAEPEHYPIPQRRLIDFPRYKKRYAEIKQLCTDVAQSIGVDPNFMASKRMVNQVISWYWRDFDDTRAYNLEPELMAYWRKPYLAEDIAALFADDYE